jgi:non-specific serine/threonine protein kinase/serine/threonine-protein kinase
MPVTNSAEGWCALKELFQAAIEVETNRRPEFLDQASAGEHGLRAKVEELLACDAAVAAHADEEDTREPLGQRLGPWRLLRKIGQGGMGTAWLAERADGQYAKQAAVKFVRSGLADSNAVRRFFRERQILASLTHPNIARLLDAGATADGIPYFVMDYVEGVPLDVWCEQQRLRTRERLDIFLKICDAVQYAHRNLVVHRDLKPANILVSAGGVPVLLDFGIATVLDAAPPAARGLTATAAPAWFTPGYASPEQMEGRSVTTASDIYSLGIVLHQLLAGHRPDQANDPEMRTLQGDLRSVSLMATRHEPEARYASVDQLAEDIRRFMGGLPVRARTATWWYRSRRFVQRRRGATLAAAAIVLAVLGGIASTLTQARIAQRRFTEVRKLANAVLYEFHPAIENLPGSTPARALLVKRALEYLNRLAQDARGDPELERELAAAYEKVGDVQGNPHISNLGDTAGARRSYEEALALRTALVARDPANLALHKEMAAAAGKMGDILRETGDLKGALARYEERARLWERLGQEHPKDADIALKVADSWQRIGELSSHRFFGHLGNSAASMASYRKALAVYESLAVSGVSQTRLRRPWSLCLDRMGDRFLAAGDTGAALEQFGKALALRQASANENTVLARRDLAQSRVKIGTALLWSGDFAGARHSFLDGLAIVKALAAADPANAMLRRDVSVFHNNTGDALLELGDAEGALAHYRHALALREGPAAGNAASMQARRDLAVTAKSGRCHRAPFAA